VFTQINGINHEKWHQGLDVSFSGGSLQISGDVLSSCGVHIEYKPRLPVKIVK
jgi:hypothetical protein